MKKLALLLACIMVFASIAVVSVSAADNVYAAPYTTTEPKMTGNAYQNETKAIWDLATWTAMSNGAERNMGGDGVPQFKVLHDANNIYVVVEYKDTDPVYPTNNENKAADSMMIAFYKNGTEDKCFGGHDYYFGANENEKAALCQNHVVYHIPLNQEPNGIQNAGECGKTVNWGNTLSGKGEETGTDYAFRSNYADGITSWEIRIPKSVLGTFTNEIGMEIQYGEVGLACPEGPVDNWSYNSYVWSGDGFRATKALFEDTATYGTLQLLAEGEAAPTPVETEPVETEPVETEPVETEPVETEPVETEPVETEPKETEAKETEKADEPAVTTDATEEPAGNAFPVIPVVIAAVVVLAIVIVAIVLAKKKKAK